MAVIDVQGFSGMRTAVASHLLQNNEASKVYNIDLENGDIIPMRICKDVATYEHMPCIRSFWRHDVRHITGESVWRVYADVRQFVESPIAQDSYGRLYMSVSDVTTNEQGTSTTRRGLYYIDADCGDGSAEHPYTEYKLGNPAPTQKITFGKEAKRGGMVTFDATEKAFYFTESADGKHPTLRTGQKVKFSGVGLPSNIVANKEYVIVTPVLLEYGDGTGYEIGETEAESIPLTIAGSGTCTVQYDDVRQTRAYVFTTVDKFGAESAPSLPASIEVDQSCKLPLSIAAVSNPQGFAPLTKKRIYRTATGASGSTGYFFLAEIAATATSYVDDKLDEELSEGLPSQDWLAPDTLTTSTASNPLDHLVLLPGGVMAAHNDAEVRFSEPYHPYAWPLAYAYTLHGKIQTIAVSQNTLFVFTDSYVHALMVDDPASVHVTTLDGFSPCLAARGVTPSPLGVLFPASDGLYLVQQGVTSPSNVTKGLISEREWQALNPKSFVAAFYGFTYVAFFRRDNGECGALLLDFSNGTQARMRMMHTHGDALLVVPGGRELYFSQHIEDMGTSALRQAFPDTGEGDIGVWSSKEFIFPTPVNMSAAIVEGDIDGADAPAHINFWGGCVGDQMCGEVPFGGEEYDSSPDGTGVALLKVFANDELRATLHVRKQNFMRLPKGYAARRWTFELTTMTRVSRVAIGTSIEELRYGQ